MASINAVGLQNSNFTATGNWAFTSGLDISSIIASTGDLTLQSVAGKAFLFSDGKVNIGSINDSVEIKCQNATAFILGADVNIDTFVLGAGTVSLAATNALAFNMGNAGCVTTIDGTSLKFPNLPSATTANILYVGVGGVITQGAVPIGGSGWNLTGTNSGATLKLGTNTTDGFTMQVNGVDIATFTATDLLFGSMGYGGGLAIDSSTGHLEAVGHSFTVNCDTGDVNINTRSTNNINLNGHGVSDLVNINIGIIQTGLVQIGSLSMPQLTMSSLVSDLYGATSLGLHSPAISINNAGSARTTTLGNVFAGNDIIMNSVAIKMLNLAADPGGTVAIKIDLATGQLYHA